MGGFRDRDFRKLGEYEFRSVEELATSPWSAAGLCTYGQKRRIRTLTKLAERHRPGGTAEGLEGDRCAEAEEQAQREGLEGSQIDQGEDEKEDESSCCYSCCRSVLSGVAIEFISLVDSL